LFYLDFIVADNDNINGTVLKNVSNTDGGYHSRREQRFDSRSTTLLFLTHTQLVASARTHLDSEHRAAFRISPRDVLFGMSPHHTNNNNNYNTEVTTGRRSQYVKLNISKLCNVSLYRLLTSSYHSASIINNLVSSSDLFKINFPFIRFSFAQSPGRVKNFLFSTSSTLALGPTQPSIQWVPGAHSPGVKRPGYEADHSPPSSAEVKKTWIYTSTSPYAFTA
jgi:hypothetical protein